MSASRFGGVRAAAAPRGELREPRKEAEGHYASAGGRIPEGHYASTGRPHEDLEVPAVGPPAAPGPVSDPRGPWEAAEAQGLVAPGARGVRGAAREVALRGGIPILWGPQEEVQGFWTFPEGPSLGGLCAKPVPAAAWSPLGNARLAGVAAVVGRRVEWALSASEIAAARGGAPGAPLVSQRLEVMGVALRLKFFPAGSRLRRRDGWCSLYLAALTPAELSFRLFAGRHVSRALEASVRGAPKELGRHDLCDLEEVLASDGSTTVGAELREVRVQPPGDRSPRTPRSARGLEDCL